MILNVTFAIIDYIFVIPLHIHKNRTIVHTCEIRIISLLYGGTAPERSGVSNPENTPIVV